MLDTTRGKASRIRGEVAVQGLGAEYLSREEILIKMGYIKIVQREDERQAAMAGLMTKQLRSPEWKSILEILVWILSGNSHADQPTERGPGGENRAGDSYVARSCMQGKITSRTIGMTWYLWETRPESRSAILDPSALQL